MRELALQSAGIFRKTSGVARSECTGAYAGHSAGGLVARLVGGQAVEFRAVQNS